MKNIPSKYAAFLAIILGISLPSFALAQNIFFKGTTFCTYMNSVFDFSVAIVGSLTVVAIIAGGIAYATSGGNPERVKSAKDIIVSSIVGMILVLGSYLLFNVIAPNVLQCKEPGTAATSTKGATSAGTGGVATGNVFPSDKSLKDICEGKSTSPTEEACNKTAGSPGSCLKGKTGWCASTCGSGQSALSAFQAMKGTCFITNHCAYTTTRALIKSGCTDFKYSSSTTATGQQMKAWGFKEHTYDPNNPQQSLAKIKPGAVLIFKGHTAMYAGNNQMIDAVPGWHSQCGLKKGETRYSELIGKNKACTQKNPYPNRNPNNPGLDKTMSNYTNANSTVQCIAQHSFKNGKPYNATKYPLLRYYQRD